MGAVFFIKKSRSKKDDRSKPLFISSPLPDSSSSFVDDEPPMVMAKSYPDIAARLAAIAARAEQVESLMVPRAPPPPPFSSRNDRPERDIENPFADNNRAAEPQLEDDEWPRPPPPLFSSNNRPERENENPFADIGRAAESQNEDVPLVLAQSYPLIAAELGEIAGRAQRGEPKVVTTRQPKSKPQQQQQPTQDSRERQGFPFAEPPKRARYDDGSMSGDVGMESPIAPELSNAARRARNVL